MQAALVEVARRHRKSDIHPLPQALSCLMRAWHKMASWSSASSSTTSIGPDEGADPTGTTGLTSKIS